MLVNDRGSTRVGGSVNASTRVEEEDCSRCGLDLELEGWTKREMEDEGDDGAEDARIGAYSH